MIFNFTHKVQAPALVQIYVSHKCNSSCVTCNIGAGEEISMDGISAEEIIKIVDMFYRWGSRFFVYTGGEPLLRKDLFYIISHACKNRISQIICTNGLLMDDRCMQKMKNIKRLRVNISLDSLNRERYKRIRGIDGLDIVIRNILMLRRNVEWMPRIFMTVNSVNYIDVYEILDFCKKNKLSFSGHPYFFFKGGLFFKKDDELDCRNRKEEVANIFFELAELAKNERFVFGFSEYYKICGNAVLGELSGPCGAGEYLIQIMPDGTCRACNDLHPFATKDDDLQELYRRKVWLPEVERCYKSNPCSLGCGYNLKLIKLYKSKFLKESIFSGKIFDYLEIL